MDDWMKKIKSAYIYLVRKRRKYLKEKNQIWFVKKKMSKQYVRIINVQKIFWISSSYVCVYLVWYTMTGYNTEEHLVIGINIRWNINESYLFYHPA